MQATVTGSRSAWSTWNLGGTVAAPVWSGPATRGQRAKRRVWPACAHDSIQARSARRLEGSSASVVRLDTTGLGTMQVLNSVGELMSDVAFESAAWDSFDMPVDDPGSFQDKIDRNMYKARFLAGVTRRRALSNFAPFQQVLVLDTSTSSNSSGVEASASAEVGLPFNCSNLDVLTSTDLLLGYADLTREELDEQAADALNMPTGAPVAVLRNCVVKAEARRRGIGTALVNGCLAMARSMLADQSNPTCLLQVYRLNDPALQLYTDAGFEVAKSWDDKEWLAGIESGALGPPQKVLMYISL